MNLFAFSFLSHACAKTGALTAKKAHNLAPFLLDLFFIPFASEKAALAARERNCSNKAP